jgi:hypothetical protein
MATKPKTPKTPAGAKTATADDLKRKATDKATEDMLTAHVMTNGQCNTVVVQQYLHFINDSSNLQALSAVSMEQAGAIGGGDFRVLEHMLWSQATALQAMFVDLATRAKRQDRFDGIQTMTTLALKAAAQSRQAVTALAELRMPKTVMFAKQANFAQQQQVNNGAAAGMPNGGRAHTEEITSSQNELLEQQHGVELDTRAQSTAGGADPHLAAVGAIHRAEVTHR